MVRDLLIFFRSGTEPGRALHAMAEAARGTPDAATLRRCARSLEEGHSLAGAFAGAGSPGGSMLVEALLEGDRTGDHAGALEALRALLERRSHHEWILARTATFWTGGCAVTMIAWLGTIGLFAPACGSIYDSLNFTVPAATRILDALGRDLFEWAVPLALFTPGILWAGFRGATVPWVNSKLIDLLKILPMLGPTVASWIEVWVLDGLAWGLDRGMGPSSALRGLRSGCPLPGQKWQLDRCREAVEDGMGLPRALRESGLVGRVASRWMEQPELAGHQAEVALRLARQETGPCQRRLATLLRAGPVVISTLLVLGVVGLVMIFLMPMIHL